MHIVKGYAILVIFNENTLNLYNGIEFLSSFSEL